MSIFCPLPHSPKSGMSFKETLTFGQLPTHEVLLCKQCSLNSNKDAILKFQIETHYKAFLSETDIKPTNYIWFW
jgi:hypothetical protein